MTLYGTLHGYRPEINFFHTPCSCIIVNNDAASMDFYGLNKFIPLAINDFSSRLLFVILVAYVCLKVGSTSSSVMLKHELVTQELFKPCLYTVVLGVANKDPNFPVSLLRTSTKYRELALELMKEIIMPFISTFAFMATAVY